MVNENQLVPYEVTELPEKRGPWLVFAPHADDESFGMGGTIAKAVQAGITVHLVVLTDGALGGKVKTLLKSVKRRPATRRHFGHTNASIPRFSRQGFAA